MTKRITTAFILSALILVSACAPRSNLITAKQVPSTKYEGLECKKLKQELSIVMDSLADASAQQDKRATSDIWLVLFFWPAVFRENEPFQVAELKGEEKALERAIIEKC